VLSFGLLDFEGAHNFGGYGNAPNETVILSIGYRCDNESILLRYCAEIQRIEFVDIAWDKLKLAT